MNQFATPTPVRLTKLAELPAVTATEVQNRFGAILPRVGSSGIAITRHNRREYVLIPADVYQGLVDQSEAPMAELRAEFDAMVAQMNTPESERGVEALFASTPGELGETAVMAARKNG